MKNNRKISESGAEYAAEQIEYICRHFDKRAPGSSGERETSAYIAGQLDKFSDKVEIEPFKVYPDAFMGWINISLAFLILGFATYFFAAMVSMMFIVISFVPLILEFVMYKRFMDPLYAEKQSQNVTAVRKCEGETKKRIFLCGNADAVWEWRINYAMGGKAFITQIVFVFVGVLYLTAITIARWINAGEIGATLAEGIYLYLGLAGLIFVPTWISAAFISNKKIIVDGANDNLSGTSVCLAVMKNLKEKGVKFENTEVGVIITGSKQAGTRGAKAWCETHGEYKNDGVETVFITFDTLREANFMQVNRRDLNGFVKNSSKVDDLFLQAAKNTDVRCSKGSVPFGATDSSAFTLGGFQSTVVTAIDHNLPKYYHTRYDSFDNISKDCLTDAVSAATEAVLLFSGEAAAEKTFYESEEGVANKADGNFVEPDLKSDIKTEAVNAVKNEEKTDAE